LHAIRVVMDLRIGDVNHSNAANTFGDHAVVGIP
jgi:hypothetical protein